MADLFEIQVDYKGKEIFFPAELLPMGYTHKIKVTVEEIEILFEPDEERNYRAVMGDADQDKTGQLNKDILQAISETLHKLFGN